MQRLWQKALEWWSRRGQPRATSGHTVGTQQSGTQPLTWGPGSWFTFSAALERTLHFLTSPWRLPPWLCVSACWHVPSHGPLPVPLPRCPSWGPAGAVSLEEGVGRGPSPKSPQNGSCPWEPPQPGHSCWHVAAAQISTVQFALVPKMSLQPKDPVKITRHIQRSRLPSLLPPG